MLEAKKRLLANDDPYEECVVVKVCTVPLSSVLHPHRETFAAVSFLRRPRPLLVADCGSGPYPSYHRVGCPELLCVEGTLLWAPLEWLLLLCWW